VRYLFGFGILALLMATSGCGSSPEPAPGWLDSIPQDKDHYYAVGISGPTPKISDAWDQAIKRARAELGRMIVSHVRSDDTSISTSSGQYVQEILSILSDAELNYTEVVERWTDRSGVYGPRDHFYVLIRMEKRKAESVFKMVR
jgi:hypothetical protein